MTGYTSNAETTRMIFQHIRARVSPYKRIRRLELNTLPKTNSGKVRRVDLRKSELGREAAQDRNPHEFWEEHFSEFSDPRKSR